MEMETIVPSETYVTTYQSVRCHNSEESNLNLLRVIG